MSDLKKQQSTISECFDGTPDIMDPMTVVEKRWGFHTVLSRVANTEITYKLLFIAPHSDFYTKSSGITVQYHSHRQEMHCIVSGSAQVYHKSQDEHKKLFPNHITGRELTDEEKVTLEQNYIPYEKGKRIGIPLNYVHSLRNPDEHQWLVIFEIGFPEIGEKYHENDITRICGPYGESVEDLRSDLQDKSSQVVSLPPPVELYTFPDRTSCTFTINKEHKLQGSYIPETEFCRRYLDDREIGANGFQEKQPPMETIAKEKIKAFLDTHAKQLIHDAFDRGPHRTTKAMLTWELGVSGAKIWMRAPEIVTPLYQTTKKVAAKATTYGAEKTVTRVYPFSKLMMTRA